MTEKQRVLSKLQELKLRIINLYPLIDKEQVAMLPFHFLLVADG